MDSDYKSLPSAMESSELKKYFEEFLLIYSDKKRDKKALDQLYELAYRQWDTYEALDEDIEEKLCDYVISAVDITSYNIMDTVMSIIENLSLKKPFDFVMDQRGRVNAPAVLRLLDAAYEEYHDIIGNPFGALDF